MAKSACLLRRVRQSARPPVSVLSLSASQLAPEDPTGRISLISNIRYFNENLSEEFKFR